MSRAIEQWEIDARERAQEYDIYRRNEFLTLNRPTQQAVVDILAQAESILTTRDQYRAQKYILRTIWAKKHRGSHESELIRDAKGVDWNEVYFHIVKGGCFSDSDMEGLTLAARRVGQELTIFRTLMELDQPEQELF